jgi:hypothetical protein
MYAMPQANTISARPGAVNYIEGNVTLDGQPVFAKALKMTFLNPNDTLSVDTGKAEILLTPGVFLRLGDNSQIRMISPSLVDTQVELLRGEAMIEVDELVKENHISVTDRGASILVEKPGLYRFTADDNPTAAVIDGKAEVYFGDKKVDLGKGRQTILSDLLKAEKFDPQKEDELYAWSNVRSEYNASASYQAARNASAGGYGGLGYGSGYGSGYGYGYGSGYGYGFGMGPGWYWNNGFDSWAWLPGNGAFFSPFGYGFYGPGLVGYAPVVVVNGLGGRNGWPGHHMVPVNPRNPPAVGSIGFRNGLPSHYASPAAYRGARAQAAHSFASRGGFRTASGAVAPAFTGSRGGSVGAQPAARGGWSGGNGGGRGSSGGAGVHGGGGGGGFHGGGGGGGSHGGGGGSGGHGK